METFNKFTEDENFPSNFDFNYSRNIVAKIEELSLLNSKNGFIKINERLLILTAIFINFDYVPHNLLYKLNLNYMEIEQVKECVKNCNLRKKILLKRFRFDRDNINIYQIFVEIICSILYLDNVQNIPSNDEVIYKVIYFIITTLKNFTCMINSGFSKYYGLIMPIYKPIGEKARHIYNIPLFVKLKEIDCQEAGEFMYFTCCRICDKNPYSYKYEKEIIEYCVRNIKKHIENDFGTIIVAKSPTNKIVFAAKIYHWGSFSLTRNLSLIREYLSKSTLHGKISENKNKNKRESKKSIYISELYVEKEYESRFNLDFFAYYCSEYFANATHCYWNIYNGKTCIKNEIMHIKNTSLVFSLMPENSNNSLSIYETIWNTNE